MTGIEPDVTSVLSFILPFGCPASILYKCIAGCYRPVSYPDGPITARYTFIKNTYWVSVYMKVSKLCHCGNSQIKKGTVGTLSENN